MPTYYKYAEREADSYINWAEIGKNMSDMLANENKVREEKKTAINEYSREFGEILSNAPQGESKLMNEWALKYAGDAQSARLMQDKLLKSGQLKLNDYLVMRQNVTDGTTSAFSLSKEYQTEFTTKWDRMKQDQSADLEQFLMAEAEGFGNFNQTQLYINPTDGKVSVAYKDKGADGVYRMSSNPSKFTDINSLRNRIKGQFDKYDVNANMESFVSGLGQELNSLQVAKATLGSTGLISETLDIMQRGAFPIDPIKIKELYGKATAGGYKGTEQQWLQDQKSLKEITTTFFEAETKALQSQLANKYNAASILTNTVDIDPTTGKPYTFTWDEADAKKNTEKILLKNKSDGSPTPQLSPEQEKVALERLRLEARLRYDKKEELKTTPQINLQERRAPAQTEVYKNKKIEEAKNFAQNLVYSLTGDAVQSQAGTKYLGAKTKMPLEKTEKGYVVTNANGNTQTFLFNPDGTLSDPLKFTKSFIGAVNTIDLDLNEDDVLRFVKELLPKGAAINQTTKASAYDFNNAPSDPFAAYGLTAGSLVGTVSKDEDEAYDQLNASLGSIGASARVPITYGDYIVIKAPNGKESKEINLADPVKAQQAIQGWLKANPKGNTPVEQKAWIKSLQETGVISGGLDYSGL